jgi:hypothetical protein
MQVRALHRRRERAALLRGLHHDGPLRLGADDVHRLPGQELRAIQPAGAMTTTTMMMMTMMMMPPPLAAATYPATCAVWPCMRCCLHRARPCESPFFWWRLRCMNSLTRLSWDPGGPGRSSRCCCRACSSPASSSPRTWSVSPPRLAAVASELLPAITC